MDLTRRDIFKQRFDNYYPLLCRIAFKYIPHTEECEDIVQETFISIWDKHKDELSDKEFISYIITATKNNCISYLRKQKIETISMDDLPISSSASSISEESPEIQGVTPEEVLAKLLALLPPKCKEVFIMSKLQNMKYREIACELDISEKTVENHIGKAIRILRENIHSYEYAFIYFLLLSILLKF